MQTWQEATEWERNWHGNCANSYDEETKQIKYAPLMGLKWVGTHERSYNLFLNGKSVLDIGGGPYSLLLKVADLHKSQRLYVVDPCDYPGWVNERYLDSRIVPIKSKGEDFITDIIFDECWIYNCLQHVDTPEKVIQTAKRYSKIIRIFEWLEVPISEGHIHTLHEAELNKWLGGEGKVTMFDDGYFKTPQYYGVFKGDHY